MNQYMIKDTHRDMKYTGTMKCACCNEESHLPETFPFYLKDMVNQLELFIKMHNHKGCNKSKVDPPEWASSKVNFGIV